MKYLIKIVYKTGDSFGSHEGERYIEGEWDIDVAKENLKRIKEHYEYYQELHHTIYPRKTENDYKKLIESALKKDWFDADKKGFSTYMDSSLLLKLNNEKEYQYYAFWCGHFETLLEAKIELKSDNNDISYIPN